MIKCRGCGGKGKMILNLKENIPKEQYTISCPGCRGEGSVNLPEFVGVCRQCRGKGKTANNLSGTGEKYDLVCKRCLGSGYDS